MVWNPQTRKQETTTRLLHARPRGGTVKCICFLASAALVGILLARGIEVRRHIWYPDRLLVRSDQISNSQFRELLDRKDFRFIYVLAFLTTASSSPFSDSSWNNASNTVECIGAGASGGAINAGKATGGGGGAYCKGTNIVISGSASFSVGTGGVAVTTASNGNDGTRTWFNSVAFPTSGSAVGAAAGVHGAQGNAGAVNGGTGGAIANNFPASTGSAGGRGGNSTNTGSGGHTATGGGGAGGLTGAGNQGVDISSLSGATAGGDGDSTNPNRGLGSAGVVGASSNPGGTGTEYDASHGSGGGSGGCESSSNSSAGDGGPFGAGGGGCSATGTIKSGAGGDGLIALNWVPVPSVGMTDMALFVMP